MEHKSKNPSDAATAEGRITLRNCLNDIVFQALKPARRCLLKEWLFLNKKIISDNSISTSIRADFLVDRRLYSELFNGWGWSLPIDLDVEFLIKTVIVDLGLLELLPARLCYQLINSFGLRGA